jgi:hypothetical protein
VDVEHSVKIIASLLSRVLIDLSRTFGYMCRTQETLSISLSANMLQPHSQFRKLQGSNIRRRFMFRQILCYVKKIQPQSLFRVEWSRSVNMRRTQNHWISGLCPSPEFEITMKHDVSETGSVSVFRWGEGDPTLFPTEYVSLSRYLVDGNWSSFRNVVFLVI